MTKILVKAKISNKDDLDIQLKKLTEYYANKALDLLLENGVDIAKSKYAGNSISVYSEKDGYKGSIIAEGKQVAYLEYGTGIKGKGTYEGNLYSDEISFVPKNQPNNANEVITLDGWTYNYRKDALGWTDYDYKGFEAKAQMFHTSEELRQYIKSGIVKDLEKIKIS